MTDKNHNYVWVSNPDESEKINSIPVSLPERSEWRCELWGCGPYGVQYRPPKGHEPNWFWRWMQYLCFGNKWRKVKLRSARHLNGGLWGL